MENNKENVQIEKVTNKSIYYKIGISLIIISLVFWVAPIVVPFMPLSLKLKGIIITSAIIIAEILFWTGAVLAGKEVARMIRSYLNPKNWFKKKVESNYEQQANRNEN